MCFFTNRRNKQLKVKLHFCNFFREDFPQIWDLRSGISKTIFKRVYMTLLPAQPHGSCRSDSSMSSNYIYMFVLVMPACRVCPCRVVSGPGVRNSCSRRRAKKKAKNSVRRRHWCVPPDRNVMGSRQRPPHVELQSGSCPLTQEIELASDVF